MTTSSRFDRRSVQSAVTPSRDRTSTRRHRVGYPGAVAHLAILGFIPERSEPSHDVPGRSVWFFESTPALHTALTKFFDSLAIVRRDAAPDAEAHPPSKEMTAHVRPDANHD